MFLWAFFSVHMTQSGLKVASKGEEPLPAASCVIASPVLLCVTFYGPVATDCAKVPTSRCCQVDSCLIASSCKTPVWLDTIRMGRHGLCLCFYFCPKYDCCFPSLGTEVRISLYLHLGLWFHIGPPDGAIVRVFFWTCRIDYYSRMLIFFTYSP